jgi:hypothetical protein
LFDVTAQVRHGECSLRHRIDARVVRDQVKILWCFRITVAMTGKEDQQEIVLCCFGHKARQRTANVRQSRIFIRQEQHVLASEPARRRLLQKFIKRFRIEVSVLKVLYASRTVPVPGDTNYQSILLSDRSDRAAIRYDDWNPDLRARTQLIFSLDNDSTRARANRSDSRKTHAPFGVTKSSQLSTFGFELNVLTIDGDSCNPFVSACDAADADFHGVESPGKLNRSLGLQQHNLRRRLVHRSLSRLNVVCKIRIPVFSARLDHKARIVRPAAPVVCPYLDGVATVNKLIPRS